jgi:hypothetical protein
MALDAVPGPAPSTFGPDVDVLDSFSNSMRSQEPLLLDFLFMNKSLPILVMAILFGGFSLFQPIVPDLFYPYHPFYDVMRIPALFFLLFSILILGVRFYHEKRAYVRYQRLGRQVLEELIVMDHPRVKVLRMKNRLVDAPDSAGGFRFAVELMQRELPSELQFDTMTVRTKPVGDVR